MTVRVFVSVPTYREAENIEELLRRMRAAVPDAHILVIDDGSDDGTAELAEKVGVELQSSPGSWRHTAPATQSASRADTT